MVKTSFYGGYRSGRWICFSGNSFLLPSLRTHEDWWPPSTKSVLRCWLFVFIFKSCIHFKPGGHFQSNSFLTSLLTLSFCFLAYFCSLNAFNYVLLIFISTIWHSAFDLFLTLFCGIRNWLEGSRNISSYANSDEGNRYMCCLCTFWTKSLTNIFYQNPYFTIYFIIGVDFNG